MLSTIPFSKHLLRFLAGILTPLLMAQSGNQEFRATWVITWHHISGGSTVAQNQARVRQIMDDHVEANMNAVLFQVRQSGTAYYNSSYEPWGYYAGGSYPGYDPLAYAVEQAHLRGLELHAWFNVFSAASTVPGAPAAEHPEWVCRDQSGIPMDANRALSPGMAAVRNYTRNVAMEIVNNYDIDGLHLDYIRWNEYSNNLRLQETGLEQISKLDGMVTEEQIWELNNNRTGRYLYDVEHPYSGGVPAGFNSWEEWWRWSVTEFVQLLHDSIQAVKPHVRLSVAALGKYNWSGWQGYGTVYQDAALWFNQGYIEQLTPMHYHWLTAPEFYGMLTGACPECWSQYIQPGIAAGRLFSVGPGSYRFEEQNVWYRHPDVVDICRTIPWVDGFQFFSYGSWNYRDYWESAGNSFFIRQTKLRETIHPASIQPPAPAITLQQIDSLNYTITVTPADTLENRWTILYRSEHDSIDPAQTTIVEIHFGHREFTVDESFNGLQDFNGRYTYAAGSANRYWKESPLSNPTWTDSIPSFAPTVLSSYPANGDTVSIRDQFSIHFSKNMDTASVHPAIQLVPPVPFILSWIGDHRNLNILFPGDLPYATGFVLTVDSSARDVNGRLLDGNGDGLEGDAYSVAFATESEDIYGPQVYHSNLVFGGFTANFDVQEVITVVFDELVDQNTLNTQTIRLQESLSGNGRPVNFNYNHSRLQDRSVLTVKPVQAFTPDLSHTLALSDSITDLLGNPFPGGTALLRTEHAQYNEITIIDNFNSVSNWQQPSYSGSTVGILAGTEWATSNDFFVPGTYPERSARLTYIWDTDASAHLLREYLSQGPPREVVFDTTYILQCYIFGDGSGNKVRFCLDEAEGSSWPNHEVSDWYTLDWTGWKLVQWILNDTSTAGEWIGNGLLDGSAYRIDSFQMTWAAGGDSSGVIYFDDFRIVKKSSELTGITAAAELPETWWLSQNYPNPFNPVTSLEFRLPVAGLVRISIYDILGREVRTLANGWYYPGTYRLQWDGTNSAGIPVASGTYLYRLQTGSRTLSKRMLLLK